MPAYQPACFTEFVEAHDPSPAGDADWNGSGETITYLGPWSGLDQFLAEVGGTAVTVNQETGIAILGIPKQHPRNPRWWAMSAKWRGLGASHDDGTSIAFDLAEVTVGFRNWPFPFDPNQPWVEASFDHAADMVTIPGYDMFFADGRRAYENMNIRVGKAAIRVMRYRIANVDYINGLFSGLVGRVNSEAFAFYGYPPGTVLLDGGRTTSTETMGGDFTMSADIAFLYSQIPWGYAWNSASHAFEDTFCGSTSGPRPYERADINQILIDPNI